MRALRNTDPVAIMRHTRRVQVIGGRNNWRSHRPYRPTHLQPQRDSSAPIFIGLAVIVAAYFIGRMM